MLIYQRAVEIYKIANQHSKKNLFENYGDVVGGLSSMCLGGSFGLFFFTYISV